MARAGLAVWLLTLAALAAHAQSSPPESGDAPAAAAPMVTVHGVVKNAATGEPLPRVLVTIESENGKGVLTDGDGRFEIPGEPVGGTVPIDLTKPGFEDTSGSGEAEAFAMNVHSMPHPVMVSADLPSLEFTMRPLNAIGGQIELSTGEPAEGLHLELLKRTVADGRLRWRGVGGTASNADGAYRFGGLSDGVYTVGIEPSIDGSTGVFPELASKASSRTGYPRIFYPDARAISGAASIHVSGGETTQANFLLKQERFYLVRAGVSGAGLDSGGQGLTMLSNGPSMTMARSGMNAEVTDAHGIDVPYRAQYDARSHTVQALLPDGDYALHLTAFGPSKPFVNSSGGVVTNVGNSLTGEAEVSVNGHAVTNLRIAMGPENSNALEVIVNRTGAEPPRQPDGNGPAVTIIAEQAGPDVVNTFTTGFAQGRVPGVLEVQPLAPGSYWLHTSTVQAGLCEASFTAGGANLGREPLVVSANGSTAPLTLTLRDDCASLRLKLPQQMAALASGEIPMISVYVVPDFDSTAEVQQHVLQTTYASSAVDEQLTPGPYHVYALTTPRPLPFHDPEAMAALNLQGQAVTLSPGATESLVVEVPAP